MRMIISSRHQSLPPDEVNYTPDRKKNVKNLFVKIMTNKNKIMTNKQTRHTLRLHDPVSFEPRIAKTI